MERGEEAGQAVCGNPQGKIFLKDGCRLMEVKHYIPTIVDRQKLGTTLEDAR